MKKVARVAGYILVIGLVYWLAIIPMLKGIDQFSPFDLIGQFVGMALLILPFLFALNGRYWLKTLFAESLGWYGSYHWQRRKTPSCEECFFEGLVPEELTCRTLLVEKWEQGSYKRRPIYARKFSCANGHDWKGR